MRREGRPSDEAVLSGRTVDRTIRPLFDQFIRNEIQVVTTVLSIGEEDPDTLGVIGASLALSTSDIPWDGPVSAIRIGKNIGDDKFIINPTYITREAPEYEFDLVACGKNGDINMIEVSGKEVPEKSVIEALTLASEETEKIQKFQNKIIKEIGKTKRVIAKPETPVEIKKLFTEKIEPRLFETIFSGPGSKNMYSLKDEWLKIAEEYLPEMSGGVADDYYEKQ